MGALMIGSGAVGWLITRVAKSYDKSIEDGEDKVKENKIYIDREIAELRREFSESIGNFRSAFDGALNISVEERNDLSNKFARLEKELSEIEKKRIKEMGDMKYENEVARNRQREDFIDAFQKSNEKMNTLLLSNSDLKNLILK